LQRGQIRQKAETPFHLIEREAHLFEGALGFIRTNVIAVTNHEQISRLIEFNQEHLA
jgi:hypothetical protein